LHTEYRIVLLQASQINDSVSIVFQSVTDNNLELSDPHRGVTKPIRTVAEQKNQNLILVHAVLAGLTPLIPIPLVDDLVKAHFLRRMVRKLAASNDYQFEPNAVKVLADDEETGCLKGCLGMALQLPFKFVFRKILFFLEWKRAVDIVSRTYYHGYLMEYAFSQRWCSPRGSRDPQEVRRGIDTVLKRVNTSLFERAVAVTFRQSKAGMKSAAALLERNLPFRGRAASEEQVAQAVEAVEAREEEEIQGIVGRLQAAINKMPAEHFFNLRRDLAVELQIEGQDEEPGGENSG
jgi:hypothetical protein